MNRIIIQMVSRQLPAGHFIYVQIVFMFINLFMNFNKSTNANNFTIYHF